jgi:hypothetical protein
MPSWIKWFQRASDLHEVMILIDLGLLLVGINGVIGNFAIDRRALGPAVQRSLRSGHGGSFSLQVLIQEVANPLKPSPETPDLSPEPEFD